MPEGLGQLSGLPTLDVHVTPVETTSSPGMLSLGGAAASPQFNLGTGLSGRHHSSSGGISLCDELNIWIKIDQIVTKS